MKRDAIVAGILMLFLVVNQTPVVYGHRVTERWGGTISGINNPPTLSSENIFPENGPAGITFTYVITYTDTDNDAPSYVLVYIDNTPREMREADPKDDNFADGKVYEYEWVTTAGDSGTHTYHFEASDGIDNARAPPEKGFVGPTVTMPTTLSIFPVSFSVKSERLKILTATLVDLAGAPLPGMALKWSATAGTLSPENDTTDSNGRSSVAYTAPFVTDTTPVTVRVSFAGDNVAGIIYLASSENVRGVLEPIRETLLSISPPTFSLYPGYSGQIRTLTATLTDNGGNPLLGKTIAWTADLGIVSPSSGTTDLGGQVTVTYSGPSVTAETRVTITASFAGDERYEPSSATSSGVAAAVSEKISASAGGIITYEMIELGIEVDILKVPPNALSTDATLTVEEGPPESPPGYTMVSQTFNLKPGGTSFAIPSTLTLPYDENEIPEGVSEEDLSVYRYTGANWENLGGTVDVSANKVSVKIDRLGEYAVMAKNIVHEPPWLAVGITTSYIIVFITVSVLWARHRMMRGEARIPSMGPGAELPGVERPALLPEKVKTFVAISRISGGAGYLLGLVSLLVVYLVTGFAPLILGVVGAILVGVGWYTLGRVCEDRPMKTYGILAIGFALLQAIFVAAAAFAVITHLVFLAPLGFLALTVALLVLQVEGGLARNLAILLVIVTMSGCVITAAGMYKVIPEVIFVGSLIWMASTFALLLTVAVLEIRNLFVAGSKLGAWLFISSGWFRLASYVVMFLMLAIWFSIPSLGVIPGLVPPTTLEAVGVLAWAALILTAGSTALAAVAFMRVKLTPEWKPAS